MLFCFAGGSLRMFGCFGLCCGGFFSLPLLFRLMLFGAECFFQGCRQIRVIIVGLLCVVASGTAYWFYSNTHRPQPFMWIWDFLIRSCSDGAFFLRIAIHAWCLQTGSLQKFLTHHQTTFYGSAVKYKERSKKMTDCTVQARKGPQRITYHLCGDAVLEAIFCYSSAVLSRGKVAVSILKWMNNTKLPFNRTERSTLME